MQFSTLVVSSLVAAASQAASLRLRDTTVTVNTDNAVAQIVVPSTSLDAETGFGKGTNLADAVLSIVDKVTALIQKMVDEDIERRKAFTQNVVARARQETGENVIMSNVGYTFTGQTTSLTSTKYNAKIGADVSYDVLTFRSGTFELGGDGGFQNWAFIVDTACQADAANKRVSCP